MEDYKKKIYKFYSNNSGYNLAPKTKKGFKSRQPFFRKIISDYFPKNKNSNILEIGSGYGVFGYFIQKAGYNNYIGIDASESQVADAKRFGINITLSNIFDYLTNIDDNTINLIIAIDVIEHFQKEELSKLADEFYRVLSDDGIVITHQPNGESPFGGGIRYGDFTHELAFTSSSISQLFLSSGFSDVVSFEDKPIGHTLKSCIRLFLWNFLIKPIYKFFLIVETGGVSKHIILTKNFLTLIRE